MADSDRQRWDGRYASRDADAPLSDPDPWLRSLGALLPRTGRALDVAAGMGRHGLWLAERGFDVTLVDISPVGLDVARHRATAAGLKVTTMQRDLDEGLPAGLWDLITCAHFLDRELYRALPAALAPGGGLVIVHPTRRNLERHPRPSARFLLDEGELLELVEGLEMVRFEECWSEGGRHEARLFARRPPRSARENSPTGLGDSPERSDRGRPGTGRPTQ